MIDASHANSNKDYRNQPLVLDDVAGQMEAGDERIFGVMIESNLVEGRQDLVAGQTLTYGQSITDGCISWDSSIQVLERSEEHTSELQSLMRISYAVFCLKKKKQTLHT